MSLKIHRTPQESPVTCWWACTYPVLSISKLGYEVHSDLLNATWSVHLCLLWTTEVLHIYINLLCRTAYLASVALSLGQKCGEGLYSCFATRKKRRLAISIGYP